MLIPRFGQFIIGERLLSTLIGLSRCFAAEKFNIPLSCPCPDTKHRLVQQPAAKHLRRFSTSYLIEPGEGSGRPEIEVDTQTDAFEERPQTPDFVPKKTGVDASTQIEVSDKLFDFEAEVQPMLAVLVGKVKLCMYASLTTPPPR